MANFLQKILSQLAVNKMHAYVAFSYLFNLKDKDFDLNVMV